MRESPGKGISREIFYRGCVPEWLSPDAIISAYYLTLLGHPPRELEQLDAIGVPRNHVWSVEHAYEIYRQQEEWNRLQGRNERVSLYHGELTEYLLRLFLRENRFQVLNLDIEGGYRRHIDPAMSPVLLFAWRNDETVIATYHSVGRDTATLYEGTLSLAIFMAIHEEATYEFVCDMAARYALAGYTDPMSMILRDLFWLRSVMEHTLATGRTAGVTPLEAVPALFCQEETIWRELKAARVMPLRLGTIRRIARAKAFDVPAAMGLEVADMTNLVYRAQWPWSQRCYYFKVERREESIDLGEWLTRAFRAWLQEPLRYADREGMEQRIFGAGSFRAADATPVLDVPERSRHTTFYSKFEPRRIEVQPSTREWHEAVRKLAERIALEKALALEEVSRGQAETPVVAPPQAPSPPAETESIIAGNGNRRGVVYTPKQVQFMSNGSLTDEGRAVIREMAADGWTTDEITAKIPRTVPRQSVVATVAVAHRKPKPSRKTQRARA